jgi:hypothetical protein
MSKYVHVVSADTDTERHLGVALDNMVETVRTCRLPVAIEAREASKREVSKWLADGVIVFHSAHLKGVQSLNQRFLHATFVRHDVSPGSVTGQFPFAIGDGFLLVTNRNADRRPPKDGQDKRYVYFIFAISTAEARQKFEPPEVYRCQTAS